MTRPINTAAVLAALLLLQACASPTPTLVAPPTASPDQPPVSLTLPPTPAATSTSIAATATLAPAATPPSDAVACPLTALDVSQSLLAARRPILVQIGNSNPERPQFGLSQADLVFETIAEGGITRLSAIYYCTAPGNTEIAGVRSGRLINLQLVPMMRAIFVHVGASEQVQALFEDDVQIRDSSLDFFRNHPGFVLLPDRRRAPFDVFTSPDALYEAARQRNIALPGDPPPSLNFSPEAPSGGEAIQSITIKHHISYWVRWKWDAAGQAWARYISNDTNPAYDAPHLEAATGRVLTAANVLVIQAPHTQTDIIEDSLNSRSVQVELIGSGTATLLRDGQLFAGQWRRANVADWFTLTLVDGTDMTLKPGNTHVHFYPTTFTLDVVK